MPKKQRRVLTEQEIGKLEGFSAIRLPVGEIAALLNMGKTELLYQQKRNPLVRRAIENGRASAAQHVRRTLFQMATGKQTKDGNYTQKPDFPALRFWCETQEGFVREEAKFKSSASISLNNPDPEAPKPTLVITIPDNGRSGDDE